MTSPKNPTDVEDLKSVLQRRRANKDALDKISEKIFGAEFLPRDEFCFFETHPFEEVFSLDYISISSALILIKEKVIFMDSSAIIIPMDKIYNFAVKIDKKHLIKSLEIFLEYFDDNIYLCDSARCLSISADRLGEEYSVFDVKMFSLGVC